jgi:hypothetical protein
MSFFYQLSEDTYAWLLGLSLLINEQKQQIRYTLSKSGRPSIFARDTNMNAL